MQEAEYVRLGTAFDVVFHNVLLENEFSMTLM